MLFSDVNILVAQEQHKDKLQEAEHERLIRTARLQQPANLSWFWNTAGVMGACQGQIVLKLQPYRKSQHTTVSTVTNLPISQKK